MKRTRVVRAAEATSTGNPTDEEPGTSATATHRRGPSNDALDAGERGHTSPEERASSAGLVIGVVAVGGLADSGSSSGREAGKGDVGGYTD